MEDEICLLNLSAPRRAIEKGQFWNHFIAGAIAGALSRTVTAPLDRLKIFKQITVKDLTIYQIMIGMLKEGGITGLWRGNLLNVLKNTPKQAIRFAVYDQYKRFLQKENCNTKLNMQQRFYSGCIAGGISHVVVYPLEMLKVRLSIRTTGRYRGMIDAIMQITRTEGIRTFGRGFVPSVLAIVPFSGLDLMCYETMKSILVTKYNRKPNSLDQFIIGAIAGLIAQVATYPLALICVQMQANESDLSKHKPKMRTILKDIWKTNGIFGLYRGMFVYLFKFIPSVGITYVAYESVFHYLQEECKPAVQCGTVLQPFMTNEIRQRILDLHNKLRNRVALGDETTGSQPAASNMNALNYNFEMEFIAQCLVNTCIYKRDKCRDGINLKSGQIFGKASGDEESATMGVRKSLLIIRDLYLQVKDFDKAEIDKFTGQGNTSDYTQIIWANIEYVGCGRIIWADSSGQFILHLICNYGGTASGGNEFNETIYNKTEKGRAASGCTGGKKPNVLYRGLCGDVKYVYQLNQWEFKSTNKAVIIIMNSSLRKVLIVVILVWCKNIL